MPYNLGAPLPSGKGLRAPLLFDFDFRLLSLGPISAASLLSTTATHGTNVRGLTFTRSTVSTVQTSDTTVDSTPGVNDACIGCRDSVSSHRGLVLQTRNQNGCPGPFRNLSSGWFLNQNAFYGGTYVPIVTTGQTGPDGTNNASQVDCGAISYVDQSTGLAQPYTFSSWQTGHSQMSMNQAISSQGNFAGAVVAVRNNPAWGRLACTANGATSIPGIAIVDGRTETVAAGGEVAQARLNKVDFVQLESGEFTTEAIIAGTSSAAGTAREDDRLDYGVGSELISTDGQLRFRFTFTPKFATTMSGVCYAVTGSSGLANAVHWWLLSWGALNTNYVRIQSSDKKLAVKFGGSEYVSTNPIAWSQFDTVVIELELGAGIASVARYNLNGGAWVNLSLATVPDTPAPGSNPVGIMRNVAFASNTAAGWAVEDRGQIPCWLHRITFYGKTPVPSELVLTEDGDTRITEAGDFRVTEPR